MRQTLFDRHILRQWRHIALVETLRLRSRNSDKRGCRIVAYKGCRTRLAPTACICTGEGKLTLNRKWVPCDPFATLFVMEERSTLTVGGSFDIYSGAKIYVNAGARLDLGSGYINHNLNLSCFGHIKIGQRVAIGENVTLRDSDDHVLNGHAEGVTRPIVVGDHVWIGMNATILKGVTIGEGAVVAAGAVVTRDIPAHCLAAGVPARVIKQDITWQ